MTTFMDALYMTQELKNPEERRKMDTFVMKETIDILHRLMDVDIGPVEKPVDGAKLRECMIKALELDAEKRIIDGMRDDKLGDPEFNVLIHIVARDIVMTLLRDWPDRAKATTTMLYFKAFL